MHSLTTILISAAVAASSTAVYSANLVANGSFETLPSGGLPFGCGTGCSYSVDTIPGWVNAGNSGQFQPGSSSGNFTYFNSVPDGLTVAYSNGGPISQVIGVLAVAGTTYNLSVDFGLRHDQPNPGSATLSLFSGNALATGIAPTAGNWSTYTASYTATAADAGKAITVTLNSPGVQGDWDNVILTAVPGAGAVPEPASWALMLTGFGLAGATMRRRRVREQAKAF
jgi:hypothetical protein